jgi:hypothetical protein
MKEGWKIVNLMRQILLQKQYEQAIAEMERHLAALRKAGLK